MNALLRGGNASALHVASAGLKALCSRLTCEGIEACRQACAHEEGAHEDAMRT
jgi:hypothetical protein